MRVVLDGVFNHCGSFNKWMDRERIYEQVEGYETGRVYFGRQPLPDIISPLTAVPGPTTANYDGWWDHATLPKLNYEESDELYRYVMQGGRQVGFPTL